MERERAIMLQTMLNPNMTQEERHSKATLSQKRLMDLERIVLQTKPYRKKHAGRKKGLRRLRHEFSSTATEKNLSITDHWFEQLGLSSKSLMAASRRRR